MLPEPREPEPLLPPLCVLNRAISHLSNRAFLLWATIGIADRRRIIRASANAMSCACLFACLNPLKAWIIILILCYGEQRVKHQGKKGKATWRNNKLHKLVCCNHIHG
tara:strand:+ start:603 stop:926 length:324 start_codon:yes stop_codon:yes gene_type:complete